MRRAIPITIKEALEFVKNNISKSEDICERYEGCFNCPLQLDNRCYNEIFHIIELALKMEYEEQGEQNE